jgi:hypothetical protein
MSEPDEPGDLADAGRRLWADVTGRFELDEAEAALLLEAARTCDVLAELADEVRRTGPVLDGKVSPAVVESRQQRLVLSRLVAALRLPQDDDEPASRPQRRGAPRGPYGVGRAS